MFVRKNLLKNVALFSMLVVDAPVFASVVTFTFSASVDSMFEYTALTQAFDNIDHSRFPGALISVGDQITGTFSYNTETPLSPYYQPPVPASGSYQIYQSAITSQGINFDISNGMHFASAGTALIQIANNASTLLGWDVFSMSASASYNPVLFQSADINLFDQTSSVFANSALPSSFGLDNFHYRNLHIGWLRQSDGNQLNVSGNFSSLIAIPIPEPQSYALFMLALGLLGLSIRLNGHTRTSCSGA